MLWIVVSLLLPFFSVANGEAYSVRKSVRFAAALPSIMADFTINPDTGAIAAVSTQTNKAYLFHRTSILANLTQTPDAEVELGETPFAITFKHYQNSTFFAVVCTQTNQMYILDGDTFQLLHAKPIQGPVVTGVFSSLNPQDPFIYYNYGLAENQSPIAVFDVRDMEDKGDVDMSYYFDSSKDGTVSADGTILYNHEGSFRTIEAYKIDNSDWQTVSRPSFKRTSYGYAAYSKCVPDPHGNYVACSNYIFDKDDVNNKVETLDFIPRCFASSEPLVFGFVNRHSTSTFDEVVAVTYNSFAPLSNLSIPVGLITPRESFFIPTGTPNNNLYKDISLKLKMLADDMNHDLVIAYADKIGTASYSCFAAADAVFLVFDNANFVVGLENQSAVFEPVNENFLIALTQLPDGAFYDSASRRLSWKPSKDQLGKHTVHGTVTHTGFAFCDFSLTLTVSFPNFELPYGPDGITINQEQTYAAIWRRWKQGDQAQSSIDFIHLDDGRKVAEKVVRFPVGSVLLDSDVAVLLQRANRDSVKGRWYWKYTAHIYDFPSLENSRSLNLGRFYDGTMIALRNGTMYIGDYAAFDTTYLCHAHPDPMNVSPSSVTYAEGIVKGGVLSDRKKPENALVLLEPGYLAVAPSQADMSTWLHMVPGTLDGRFWNIPGTELFAQLHWLQEQYSINYLSFWRDKNATLRLFDTEGKSVDDFLFIDDERDYYPDIVVAKEKALYVTTRSMNNRWSTYRWTMDSEPSASCFNDPRFVPAQDYFRIETQGSTALSHEVNGGTPPYKFFLNDPTGIMLLDQDTGVLIVDGSMFQTRAIAEVVRVGVSDGVDSVRVASLKSKRVAPWAALPKSQRPNGVPVGLPVFLRVVDSQGYSASIGYYVYSDVLFETVESLIIRQSRI